MRTGCPRHERRSFLVFLCALVATACEGGQPSKLPFKGTDITGAEHAKKLALPDVDGQTRTLDEFKGKVTVVFFGYTQCPDVCPATMYELAQARAALGEQGRNVQGIFVTIDPERDTRELLKAYVKNFGADFIALRGDPKHTQAAADEFKIFFRKVRGTSPDSYAMDHTAGAYLFDKQGRPRVFLRHGSGPEVMQHDLKLLLDA